MAQNATEQTPFVADDNAETNTPQTIKEHHDNVVDYTTGETLDAKTIRVKIANEQAAAIELLKQHYSQRVGKELNISELLVLLIEEDLREKFSLSHRQLTAAFQVQLPKLTLPTLTFGGAGNG